MMLPPVAAPNTTHSASVMDPVRWLDNPTSTDQHAVSWQNNPMAWQAPSNSLVSPNSPATLVADGGISSLASTPRSIESQSPTHYPAQSEAHPVTPYASPPPADTDHLSMTNPLYASESTLGSPKGSSAEGRLPLPSPLLYNRPAEEGEALSPELLHSRGMPQSGEASLRKNGMFDVSSPSGIEDERTLAIRQASKRITEEDPLWLAVHVSFTYNNAHNGM